MLFLMISTKASQRYTSLAINSLLRSTFFRKKDRLLVIDNDGDLDISDVCGWDLIKNEAPRGFAENANCGLRLARKLKTDLILLNNDIIFTKHWLEFMNPKSDRISVPYCNQDVQYSQGGFSLHFAMNLADYDENNDSNLEIIAERHRRLCETSRFNNVIFSLIPFFCAHIPYEVSVETGDFDESFGRGGGEDVDYRLRAAMAGFRTEKTPESYVLHFMGKSTWLSGEAGDITSSRDRLYRNRFSEKWGDAVASLFLAGPDKIQMAEKLGVFNFIKENNLGGALRALLK